MLPPFIAPQFATAREDVPAGADWIHEIKFDGYRILAYIDANGVRLLSRNTLEWSGRFRQVVDALADVRARDAVIDGEVCVLDERGRADFQTLQALVEDRKPARLSYLVFDLLWLDGEDLRRLPLLERKARLKKLVPKRNAVVQYVDHFEGDGIKFFVGVCENGLEGIVSKRADAHYESGRTKSWIKVKCVDAREFAVVGYVPSEKRDFFKSLIVAEPAGKRFEYRGLVGGGFTQTLGRKIAAMLKPLETEAPPLDNVPWELRRTARWARPEYVAQVRFTEITREGSLRHPRFIRLRHVSEPGAAEHLRSRTIEDRKPKKKRAAKRKAEAKTAPDQSALLDALRESVGAKGKSRGGATRQPARGRSRARRRRLNG
jgi:bifunctional non-homologous end joining protein LigD